MARNSFSAPWSFVACLLAALLASAHGRLITGTVSWSTGGIVSGAVVKAYDMDAFGTRDFMGQAITSGSGTYSISYSNKDWDVCCLKAKRPDIQIEVYVNGKLFLKTGELASNVGSDRTFNLVLTSRTFSGVVFWAGTNERVANAQVNAYDDDLIGRDFMGSATTNSNGEFRITWSPQVEYDSCCFDSKRADPELEVWVNGKRWMVTSTKSDVNTDQTYSIGLTRIIVTGTAYWQETCRPASNLPLVVKDDDALGTTDTMGTGITASDGKYSMNINWRKDGGEKNWDLGFNNNVRPDLYTEFVWGGSAKGQTSIQDDVPVSAGNSVTINQGDSFVWRGDATTAAKPTQSALKLDTVDWVEVEEFNSCTPRQMRVTVYVDFRKAGDISTTRYNKLKTLTKQGMAENWSRTGSRAVLMSNGVRYDVVTRVVESEKGHDCRLSWQTGSKYKRSHNIGSVIGDIPLFSSDPIIFYNAGWCQANYGTRWEAECDVNFKDTAAHEFGHSILRAAPPIGWKRSWLGPIPLTLGQSYSWTHKGTTTVTQKARSDAPVYPTTGDADLMFYFRGNEPADFESRSIAAEDDVRRLVGIASKKRVRLSTCACP